MLKVRHRFQTRVGMDANDCGHAKQRFNGPAWMWGNVSCWVDVQGRRAGCEPPLDITLTRGAVRRSLSGFGEGSPPAGSGGRLTGRAEGKVALCRGRDWIPSGSVDSHRQCGLDPAAARRDRQITRYRGVVSRTGPPTWDFGGEWTPDSIVSSAYRLCVERQSGPPCGPTAHPLFVLYQSCVVTQFVQFSARTSSELPHYDAHFRECK